MADLSAIRIAYTSRRPFFDGPVRTPFPENDPANIAYVLHGDYFSFLSLKNRSVEQLRQLFRSYDLIFLAMDLPEMPILEKIAAAAAGRLVTYSEGHIDDYQLQPPATQVAFLKILNQAVINFIYWEKYVPFYRTLTEKPVAYLPYPFFSDQTDPYRVPIEKRSSQVNLPSGFDGFTRNGMASLAVARKLIQADLVERVQCWVSPENIEEDRDAVFHFLLGKPFQPKRKRLRWREWLYSSRLDYRWLLKLVHKKISPDNDLVEPAYTSEKISIYKRTRWTSYLSAMAHASLVIDMNNRITVGRNALDCAALQIPCVSTSSSDLQLRLFPDTTIQTGWDIEAAFEISSRLLQQPDYYHQVVETATARLVNYGPGAFLDRLNRHFDTHSILGGTEAYE